MIKLVDAPENVDAHSTILISCFENPVVAPNEMTLGHSILRGIFTQEKGFVLGAFNNRKVHEALLDVTKLSIEKSGWILLNLRN